MKVLIVDPDATRSPDLKLALATNGVEVTVAPSGSFALTMLEWNRHDVVVSRARIDDMDGRELCAILKSDPGTRDVRFVLVAAPGEVSAAQTTAAGVDLIVPPTLTPTAVVPLVLRLVPGADPKKTPPPAATPPARPLVTPASTHAPAAPARRAPASPAPAAPASTTRSAAAAKALAAPIATPRPAAAPARAPTAPVVTPRPAAAATVRAAPVSSARPAPAATVPAAPAPTERPEPTPPEPAIPRVAPVAPPASPTNGSEIPSAGPIAPAVKPEPAPDVPKLRPDPDARPAGEPPKRYVTAAAAAAAAPWSKTPPTAPATPAGPSLPPINLDAMPSGTFQGSLEVMDLADLTQAIAMGGKKGRLILALPQGGGVVAFEGGHVVHAEYRGTVGEAAFAALLAAVHADAAGRFCFLPCGPGEKPSPSRTIEKSVDRLLLSIATAIDEKG